MDASARSRHGGKRDNAGRKPGGKLRVNVMLSPEEHAQAKALGDGNVSRGLAVALASSKSVQRPAPHGCGDA